MFCVYVLESKKNKEKLYIGFTANLKQRVAEHNRGESRATKPYIPWKCVYTEYCIDEDDARRREKYFKTSQGRRFLRRRLKEYFYKKSRRAS